MLPTASAEGCGCLEWSGLGNPDQWHARAMCVCVRACVVVVGRGGRVCVPELGAFESMLMPVALPGAGPASSPAAPPTPGTHTSGRSTCFYELLPLCPLPPPPPPLPLAAPAPAPASTPPPSGHPTPHHPVPTSPAPEPQRPTPTPTPLPPQGHLAAARGPGGQAAADQLGGGTLPGGAARHGARARSLLQPVAVLPGLLGGLW